MHIKQNIVKACKVIVKLGLDSGPFGNISLRETDGFWINSAGVTFNHIHEDHIIKMNLEGDVIIGNVKPHPGEFIHREIYKLRPDIQSIVHTHSDNTVALSLLGCEIEPFTQLGASLFNDQSLYLGFTGPVRSTDEGLAIAQALGTKSIVIAKNHGLFATGSTIQAALWDMIVADNAAKIHLTARQHGLMTADKISEEFMLKSKIEVREKQSSFMWEAFIL